MRETCFRDNLPWRSVNHWINIQRGFLLKLYETFFNFESNVKIGSKSYIDVIAKYFF